MEQAPTRLDFTGVCKDESGQGYAEKNRHRILEAIGLISNAADQPILRRNAKKIVFHVQIRQLLLGNILAACSDFHYSARGYEMVASFIIDFNPPRNTCSRKTDLKHFHFAKAREALHTILPICLILTKWRPNSIKQLPSVALVQV